MLVFVFSLRAFAQGTIGPPTNPPILCTLDLEFIPNCSMRNVLYGKYIIQICSTSVGNVPHETIFEWIQSCICAFQSFPDYVTVKGYTPIRLSGIPRQ